MLALLPLYSRFFGIHPWQIERLTLREISEYNTRLHELEAAGVPLWGITL